MSARTAKRLRRERAGRVEEASARARAARRADMWQCVFLFATIGIVTAMVMWDGCYDGRVYKKVVGFYGEVSYWPTRVAWISWAAEGAFAAWDGIAWWIAGEHGWTSVPAILRMTAGVEVVVGGVGACVKVWREEVGEDERADA